MVRECGLDPPHSMSLTSSPAAAADVFKNLQVVLSAAVCTKNGKALLSRQFLDMSRIRIEGLLAAFPKLMGTGAGTQHTFIETDSVRYIYQPIEDLFLLLITNKASNIVEDLETLRLLSKLVPEVAGGISEDRIMDKMFELVFAFDEVLTTGGHRENITMAQIQTNLTMDSHEEKLHKMIEQSKIGSAKEEADRKAKAFREEKRQQKMAGIGSGLTAVGGGIEGGQSSTPGDTYGDKHMSGGDGCVWKMEKEIKRGSKECRHLSLHFCHLYSPQLKFLRRAPLHVPRTVSHTHAGNLTFWHIPPTEEAALKSM